MIRVFIPHRWNNDDYEEIRALLGKIKFTVTDYSVPINRQLNKIDKRYNLDPQIQNRIKYASVVVCSNRPANNNGMTIDEIRFAVDIGKPVVAIQITNYTSNEITRLGIQTISKRKDSLESWIVDHTNHH